MNRTGEMKRRVVDLGFDHVGVARAEVLRPEGERLRNWLSNGAHADMHYMERRADERIDPGLVFPGCKTVISVAYNYFTGHRHPPDGTTAKISRYAWGDDYHDVLRQKLVALRNIIRDIDSTSESRVYVDTGPVMDKAWAVRAGVGWIGKHTNVITRDRGSWIFLGSVLTTADFEPDTPLEDYCGSCTACIDACPTRAITAPYVLDAGRCISYLTIERRGDPFPEEESLPVDDWIFGCDVCQDVCPWNSFARETRDPAFQPREGSLNLDPRRIAELDETEYHRRFHKSPVKRATLEGLRRNARIVLAQRESHLPATHLE